MVVPDAVGDPRRPSGGNTYDRRVRQELAAAGWTVDLQLVPGDWPRADPESRLHLAAVLAGSPDGARVLLDGLVALAAPEEVVPASDRLRTVVLVHMPLGDERETAVLRSATAVVTTSRWTRRWLLSRHRLDPSRVHVAAPGVDPAPAAVGTPEGGALLCVGAVVPAKGQELLVRALGEVADLRWRCVCVGSQDRDPAYVAGLRATLRAAGLGDRVELTGPLTGARLAAAYAAADVLVHPSRTETYGMVLTEALARGLPVLACDVGGVSEAVGTAPDGRLPGVLTPADDPVALARSLRGWLTDDLLRRRLRAAARGRRVELAGWPATGRQVARVLEEVAA
ncbi:glycosyltransferase family 4 protein [Nocardioides sp.]|uniref:glycosyltransferase family 4 protein n=1 Tax=Nocardioides sp. TaxID=35761 RepID=UPI002ED4A523